jgi:hypothetical protein
MALALAFAMSLAIAPAQAQIARQLSPQAATNPKPADGDYLVPLPCDLSMAFRVIFIPERGLLGEVTTYFGADRVVESGSQEQNFINRKHKGYLGSALSIDSLPESFQAKAWELKNALSDDKEGRQLYLIGKYEVSNAQYRAVMANDCELKPDSALPVTGISWYEATDFTAKLMEWLLANAPDSLPRDPGDQRSVGLLRLPTEEEWEFAARGGHNVSQDDLAGEEFFPMDREKGPRAYGVYSTDPAAPLKAPAWIGTLLPNPAGIHDTVGNVAEFIFEAFQMTLGSRLHGSAGGPVSKGGSFKDVQKDVSPGTRTEFAFFRETGPAKSPDLGFRVAISSVNMGSFGKLDQIAKEYGEATKTDSTLAEDDPIKVVEQLILSAENPVDRRSYETLRSSLLDYNFRVNEQRKLSAKMYISNLIYGVLGIRTNAVRLQVTNQYVKMLQDAISQVKRHLNSADTSDETKKSLRSKLPALEASLKDYLRRQNELNTAYARQRERYETLLLQSTDYPPELIFEQLAMVKQDIKGDDRYSLQLSGCYTTVANHLDLILNKKGKPSSIKRAELEQIPQAKS